MVFLLTLSALKAQSPDGPKEREYPASLASLTAALKKLGAYQGSRLPMLEGFVQTQGMQLDRYQHPYYEFKIDLVPGGSGETLVRVKAGISAWYSEGDEKTQGYRVLQSNGRLETDLLDRLSEYLAQTKPPTVPPPHSAAPVQQGQPHRRWLHWKSKLPPPAPNASKRSAASPSSNPCYKH